MSEWHIAVKLADQPLAPKSILRLPETELGECPLGGCSISHLKQLITGKLQESVPDPELIGRCTGRGQLLPSCGSAEGGSKPKLCESLPWGFPVAADPDAGRAISPVLTSEGPQALPGCACMSLSFP